MSSFLNPLNTCMVYEASYRTTSHPLILVFLDFLALDQSILQTSQNFL